MKRIAPIHLLICVSTFVCEAGCKAPCKCYPQLWRENPALQYECCNRELGPGSALIGEPGDTLSSMSSIVAINMSDPLVDASGNRVVPPPPAQTKSWSSPSDKSHRSSEIDADGRPNADTPTPNSNSDVYRTPPNDTTQDVVSGTEIPAPPMIEKRSLDSTQTHRDQQLFKDLFEDRRGASIGGELLREMFGLEKRDEDNPDETPRSLPPMRNPE